MSILQYDPAVVAYLAGLFDGEGCVKIKARVGKNQNSQANLTISNTDLRPLVMARDYFGGSIYVPSTRKCASWTVNGAQADEFANVITPYVIIKSAQLELFKQFRLTMLGRGRPRVSDEVFEERGRIEAQVIELRRQAYA